MTDGAARSRSGPHPRAGSVDFVDDRNVLWRVTERDARYDPGSRGDWCLIFASENAIRRVWNYPPSWRSLSAVELEMLSWMPGGPRSRDLREAS